MHGVLVPVGHRRGSRSRHANGTGAGAAAHQRRRYRYGDQSAPLRAATARRCDYASRPHDVRGDDF